MPSRRASGALGFARRLLGDCGCGARTAPRSAGCVFPFCRVAVRCCLSRCPYGCGVLRAVTVVGSSWLLAFLAEAGCSGPEHQVQDCGRASTAGTAIRCVLHFCLAGSSLLVGECPCCHRPGLPLPGMQRGTERASFRSCDCCVPWSRRNPVGLEATAVMKTAA